MVNGREDRGEIYKTNILYRKTHFPEAVQVAVLFEENIQVLYYTLRPKNRHTSTVKALELLHEKNTLDSCFTLSLT